MIHKQIDDKTRIIKTMLGGYGSTLVYGPVYKLQKHKKYRWRTIAWNYAYVLDESAKTAGEEYIENYLFWAAQRA